MITLLIYHVLTDTWEINHNLTVERYNHELDMWVAFNAHRSSIARARILGYTGDIRCIVVAPK